MSPDDRLQLARLLLTFDEPGLVALANKGLVRRATKDLEGAELRVEEHDSGARVHGNDWIVEMPVHGPTRATDNTPATGITRQILAATIWLRDHWAPSNSGEQFDAVPVTAASDSITQQRGATNSSPLIEQLLDRLRELTSEELERWAGKTLLRDAQVVVSGELQSTWDHTNLLRVSFPEHEVEVRLVPSEELLRQWRKSWTQLLDAFLCTAPKAFRSRWVVVAILIIRRELGSPLSLQTADVAPDAEGTPRSRQELLESIQIFLTGLIVTGLTHASDLVVQRLFTLSVACTGCHLPRLAKLLSTLASEQELILQRSAAGDSGRLLELMSDAFALVLAMRQQEDDHIPLWLAGRHRTEYDSIGRLSGVGCGAYPWRTKSGYEGISLLIWDRERKRFWSWSDSRPEDTRGFDLRTAYVSSRVWTNAGSAEQLSRSEFVADGVQANHLGRLSASQQTVVTSRDFANADAYQQSQFGEFGFDDWNTLAEHARRTEPIGFANRDPLQRVVVVYPTTWGPRTYEELHQRLVWLLFDVAGAPLKLTIPWTAVSEQAIECLEALKSDRDKLSGVIGIMSASAGEISLFPVAVLSAGTPQGDRLINLAFDQNRLLTRQSNYLNQLREKYGRNQIASTLVLDDDSNAPTTSAVLSPGIEKLLSGIEAVLLQIAETGGGELQERTQQKAKALCVQASRMGLTLLATSLSLLNAAGRPDHHVLLAKHLCTRYRAAARAG